MVGMLRPKGAPEFASRPEKTELRPFLEHKKATERIKHEPFHKSGQGSRPSRPKMPKLGVGKTILKRPTLTMGQKDSTEEHNKTTLPELGEGAAIPSLQITIPKKL
ncbi:hypothetical protein GBA52_004155 [Prunus armeniaca]|nr:hypothetical protein GBA52_004155 [Prunus armeniaca]